MEATTGSVRAATKAQAPILDLGALVGDESVVREGHLHQISADARRLVVEVRSPQPVGVGAAVAEGSVHRRAGAGGRAPGRGLRLAWPRDGWLPVAVLQSASARTVQARAVGLVAAVRVEVDDQVAGGGHAGGGGEPRAAP